MSKSTYRQEYDKFFGQTQKTWTQEQQERVLQLIDYCTEMTSGYLSGWAKSLMADLKCDKAEKPFIITQEHVDALKSVLEMLERDK